MGRGRAHDAGGKLKGRSRHTAASSRSAKACGEGAGCGVEGEGGRVSPKEGEDTREGVPTASTPSRGIF